MKLSLSLLVAFLTLGLCGCGSTQTHRTYSWPKDLRVSTNVSGGYRSVDHPIFEDHAYAGLEVTGYKIGAPAGLEIGATFATEDESLGNTDYEGQFSEGYLGLRKTFGPEDARMRTFVSAGGTYMRISRDEISPSGTRGNDEWTGGGYLRGGIYWSLGRLTMDGGTELLIGLDVRAVAGEDADFVQSGLFLGFGR